MLLRLEKKGVRFHARLQPWRSNLAFIVVVPRRLSRRAVCISNLSSSLFAAVQASDFDAPCNVDSRRASQVANFWATETRLDWSDVQNGALCEVQNVEFLPGQPQRKLELPRV